MQSSATFSPKQPYLLFIVAFVLLATVGTLFQMVFGLHLGLIASQVFVILATALIYRKVYKPRNTRHWPTFKRLGMPVAMVPLVIITAILVGLLANTIGGLTVELIPGLREFAEQYQESVREIMLNASPVEVAMGMIAVTVAAPICEEVLFRGTILAEQRRHERVHTAIILNGLLFSAMHLNPMFFLSLAIIGCFLAHLTTTTWSIWPAILGHFAINFFNGVILTRFGPEMGAESADVAELGATGMEALISLAISLAILAPLAGFLWWLVIRFLAKNKAE